MIAVIQLFFCILLSQILYAQEPFSGVVTKVIDGDSLQITVNRQKIETRLYGIDCPEYDQHYSKQAKKFVKKKVYGQKVIVYPEYRDSYGRLVAIVQKGAQSLNQELVASGYAWVYPRYCKKEICNFWEASEKNARQRKYGLWTEPRPVPPWKWKRRKKR